MDVGAKIKEARLAAGLTQRELADLMGVDPVTVSRWERGKVEMSVAGVSKIAAFTGQPFSFFVDLDAA